MAFLDGDDYAAMRAAASQINIREGDAGHPVYHAKAVESIRAGQAIWVGPTGAKRATGHVSGVAITDTNSGGVVVYRVNGLIFLHDWTEVTGAVYLEPGARYFLHAPGDLRTFPATSGYVAEVGEAHSARLLNIRPGTFVKL